MGRIALNALSARAGATISSFIHLMPALKEVDANNKYVVFVSKQQSELLEAVPDGFTRIILNGINNPILRMMREQIFLPFYLFYLKIDVLYSVGNLTTLLAPCRIVLLIENANPYSHLDMGWSRWESLRNKLIRIVGWLSAKRADVVRFVSENSKSIIAKRLGLPLQKCITIYQGFSPTDDKGGENLPSQYILNVSVVYPHKNLYRLIEAFYVLIKKYGYGGDLILVGDLIYRDYVDRLRVLISSLKLDRRVILRGKIAHQKIKQYYLKAEAFVFPSLVETFGMPVIEAMGYGLPVVVSDESLSTLRSCFTPFKEICGEAACYINPLDPKDIAEKVNRVVSDQNYRTSLILKGKTQVKKFTWEATAQSLVQLFEKESL